jgi:organic radical activating enzyme
MNVYFLQLTLTKNCNQNCYYCDVFQIKDEIEVDLDFLKYVLSCYPKNLMVELTGGETGLVKNLDDVYRICLDNTVAIQVMSNGLVRKRGFDWLENVYYNEHLIKEIVDKDIIKFYDLDFEFKNKWKYVIVTTEITTKSLLKNQDHWNTILKSPFFWFKLMNPKTHDISRYSKELKDLFSIVNDSNSIDMIEYTEGIRNFDSKKILCQKYPPQPAIDFETKEIVHCATTLMKCERKPFTKQNVDLNLKSKLFTNFDSCVECYTFDTVPDKINRILSCLKGNLVNRRI